MTNYPNLTANLWLDCDALSTETIDLSSEKINQAVELSSAIPNEERQWQTYLNALALFGFEQWLEERAPEVHINREQCSLFDAPTANVIEAVCNLKVNDFNLCLIATGSLADEEVIIPRAVVDLPEFIPHFYVLVEVQEELSTVTVQGFLSSQDLRNQQTNLQADEDWTYWLPVTWFEDELDSLLLYLRALEPTAISSPSTRSNCSIELSRIRSELEALLPQLQSPERQLGQVLTWEQGSCVLVYPELLNWLYQAQQQSSQGGKFVNYLSDLLGLLTQPTVNVGRWFNNQLDDFAQGLSWVLLPSVAPAYGMRSTVSGVRSPGEEFEAIVTQLRQTQVNIPAQASAAYRDLELAAVPLRLYAVTWPLLSDSVPEWSLLLVLVTRAASSLPSGVRLRVSDQTGVLVERVLETQQQNSYLFTRVVGTWDERFVVTISLGSGIAQTLPPFGFNPQPSP
ncbi:MAG TPA: DUF1822 family protein [Coleofasciculaceae cyanobacterium]